jgi:death-on-curing protein
MTRISLQQALLIHKYLIEVSRGMDGVRDQAALESALNTPFQTFEGNDLYPGKERKAAALCYGLIQNHPLVDGNKRIGVHLCDVFLRSMGSSWNTPMKIWFYSDCRSQTARGKSRTYWRGLYGIKYCESVWLSTLKSSDS